MTNVDTMSAQQKLVMEGARFLMKHDAELCGAGIDLCDNEALRMKHDELEEVLEQVRSLLAQMKASKQQVAQVHHAQGNSVDNEDGAEEEWDNE